MVTRGLTATLVVVGLALVVACGGGDDSEEGGQDSGASGANPTAADPTASGGGAALGDFEVPLPAWAEAVTPDIGSGPLDVVLFRVPLDQRDATIAFFEDWSNAQTEAFLRTDGASGGVTLQSEVAAGE